MTDVGLAIYEAVDQGDATLLQRLCQEWLDDENVLNWANPDEGDDTPLLHAVHKGNFDCVKVLVALPGIDINRGNRKGYTPLHRAANNGHLEIVRLLTGLKGIHVNKNCSSGWSPHWIAAISGHVETMRVISEVHKTTEMEQGRDLGVEVEVGTQKEQSPDTGAASKTLADASNTVGSALEALPSQLADAEQKADARASARQDSAHTQAKVNRSQLSLAVPASVPASVSPAPGPAPVSVPVSAPASLSTKVPVTEPVLSVPPSGPVSVPKPPLVTAKVFTRAVGISAKAYVPIPDLGPAPVPASVPVSIARPSLSSSLAKPSARDTAPMPVDTSANPTAPVLNIALAAGTAPLVKAMTDKAVGKVSPSSVTWTGPQSQAQAKTHAWRSGKGAIAVTQHLFSRLDADTSLSGATRRAVLTQQQGLKRRQKAMSRFHSAFEREAKHVAKLHNRIVTRQRRIAFSVLEACSAVIIQTAVRRHQASSRLRLLLAATKLSNLVTHLWLRRSSRVQLKLAREAVFMFCFSRCILPIRARRERAARCIISFIRWAVFRRRWGRIRVARGAARRLVPGTFIPIAASRARMLLSKRDARQSWATEVLKGWFCRQWRKHRQHFVLASSSSEPTSSPSWKHLQDLCLSLDMLAVDLGGGEFTIPSMLRQRFPPLSSLTAGAVTTNDGQKISGGALSKVSGIGISRAASGAAGAKGRRVVGLASRQQPRANSLFMPGPRSVSISGLAQANADPERGLSVEQPQPPTRTSHPLVASSRKTIAVIKHPALHLQQHEQQRRGTHGQGQGQGQNQLPPGGAVPVPSLHIYPVHPEGPHEDPANPKSAYEEKSSLGSSILVAPPMPPQLTGRFRLRSVYDAHHLISVLREAVARDPRVLYSYDFALAHSWSIDAHGSNNPTQDELVNSGPAVGAPSPETHSDEEEATATATASASAAKVVDAAAVPTDALIPNPGSVAPASALMSLKSKSVSFRRSSAVPPGKLQQKGFDGLHKITSSTANNELSSLPAVNGATFFITQAPAPLQPPSPVPPPTTAVPVKLRNRSIRGYKQVRS